MKNNILIISGISSVIICTALILSFKKGDTENEEVKSIPTLTRPIGNSTKPLYHLNNVYVFDLSNRTRMDSKRRVSDISISEYFVNEIDGKFKSAFNRRSVIQKDIHRIQTTSPELYNQFDVQVDHLTCDLSKYKRPIDLSNFLFNRNDDGQTMDAWEKDCLVEFKSLYNKATNESKGADLYSYVKDCKRYFGKSLPDLMYGKNKRKNKYKENLFLITDGYIEYGQYSNEKLAPYLSSKKIKAFKKDYLKRGGNRSLEQFFKDEGYGITPVFDEIHSNINVIVIGFEDRSVNDFGLANKGVKIKDREVMELFWNDWLTKSGFNKVKIAPVLSSKSELDELIMNFINI